MCDSEQGNLGKATTLSKPNSIKFGQLTEFYGILNSMENSMEFHGKFIHFHKIQWNFMENSMEFHGKI
jgi:hypothetical protein